jgi:hypothetical protein
MKKKISGLGVPLLFILPVAGFFVSLFHIRSKSSAFVYISFAMLFGYAISFADTSADSYRYAQAFARFDRTIDYNNIVELYRSGESRDMYRLLLFYFTSLFSNNPKVMYAFAGLVYGVLSYLSLRILVKEGGPKLDTFAFVLALVFYTYVSLSNINGFRFNTGAVLFFYATYRFLIRKEKKWIIGILITPLFHYGFVPIVPVIVLYRLLESSFYNKKNVLPILFYAFVLAFTTSWILGTNSISLSFLSQTDVMAGAVGQRMSYVNSDATASLVDSRRESSLFLSVQKYFDYGIKIYVFVVVFYMRNWLKGMMGNKTEYTRLLAFVLFFYAVTFIATSFPSGARFFNIAHLFMILLLAKFYAVNKGPRIKKIIIWTLPVFGFNILFINGLLPILILTPTFWYGNIFWIIMEGIN